MKFLLIIITFFLTDIFFPGLLFSRQSAENKNNLRYPVYRGEKLAFIDSKGNIVFSTETKTPFREADIYINNKKQAEFIRTDLSTQFSEGLVIFGDQFIFPFDLNQKFLCFDISGSFVFEKECEWLGTFSNGYAQICIADRFLGLKIGELWGFINRKGEISIDAKYDFISPFSEGMAAFKIDDQWGYLDTTGTIIIKPQFRSAGTFSGNLAPVNISGKFGYINKEGQKLISFQYEKAWPFKDGAARVFTENSFAYIDTSGKFINDQKYEFAQDFSQGLAAITIENKTGFINTNGDLVIEARFSKCSYFSNGLAPVQIDGKWGYINSSGQIAIPANLTYALPFINKLALVWEGERAFYIDKTGNEIKSLFGPDIK